MEIKGSLSNRVDATIPFLVVGVNSLDINRILFLK